MGDIRPNLWDWEEVEFEDAERPIGTDDANWRKVESTFAYDGENVGEIWFEPKLANSNGRCNAVLSLKSNKKLIGTAEYVVSFDVVSKPEWAKLSCLFTGNAIGSRYEHSMRYDALKPILVALKVVGEPSFQEMKEPAIITIKNIKLERVPLMGDPHATPYVEYDKTENPKVWVDDEELKPEPHPPIQPDPKPKPEPNPAPNPMCPTTPRANVLDKSGYYITQAGAFGCTITQTGERTHKIEKTSKSAELYFSSANFKIVCGRHPAGQYTLSFKVEDSSRPLYYYFDNQISKKGGPVGKLYQYTFTIKDEMSPNFAFTWGDNTDKPIIGDYAIISDIKVERITDPMCPYPTVYTPKLKDASTKEEIAQAMSRANDITIFRKDPSLYYKVPDGIFSGAPEQFLGIYQFTLRPDTYIGNVTQWKNDTPDIPDAFYSLFPVNGYRIAIGVTLPPWEWTKRQDGGGYWVHPKIKQFENIMKNVRVSKCLLAGDPVTITRQGYTSAVPTIHGSEVELRILTREPQRFINSLLEIEEQFGDVVLSIAPIRNYDELISGYPTLWNKITSLYYTTHGIRHYKIDTALSTADGLGASDANEGDQYLGVTLRGSDTAFLKNKVFKRDLDTPINMMSVVDEAMRAMQIPFLRLGDDGNAVEVATRELNSVFDIGAMDSEYPLYDLLEGMLNTIGRSLIVDGDTLSLVPSVFNYSTTADRYIQPAKKIVYPTQLELVPPLSAFSWSFSKNSDAKEYRFRPRMQSHEKMYTKSEAEGVRYGNGKAPALRQRLKRFINDKREFTIRQIEKGYLPLPLSRYLLGRDWEGADTATLYANLYNTVPKGVYVLDGDVAFSFTGYQLGLNKDAGRYVTNQSYKQGILLNTRNAKDGNYILSFDISIVFVEEVMQIGAYDPMTGDFYKNGRTGLEEAFSTHWKKHNMAAVVKFLIDGVPYTTKVTYGYKEDARASLEVVIPKVKAETLIEYVGVDGKITLTTSPRRSQYKFDNDAWELISNGTYSSDDLSKAFQSYLKISNINIKENTSGYTVKKEKKDDKDFTYIDKTVKVREEVLNSDFGGAWLTGHLNGDEVNCELIALPVWVQAVRNQKLYNMELDTILNNIKRRYAPLADGAYSQHVVMYGTNGVPKVCYCEQDEDFMIKKSRYGLDKKDMPNALLFVAECEYSLKRDIATLTVLTPVNAEAIYITPNYVYRTKEEMDNGYYSGVVEVLKDNAKRSKRTQEIKDEVNKMLNS